jgi:uncharacterized Zn finger protein
MTEAVLIINCDSCGQRTEHVLAKNVEKEFEYVCLKCGKPVAMREINGMGMPT